ncbi:MAG TPA: SEC-C metal-binding domain-containing protein, partial [Ktedonobacteraceae bacterium]|nr:SEC-C metal-binding domain-containing protein [Ktedonobacteraceae bacterium]
IYEDRRAVLEHADMHARVLEMMRAEVEKLVNMYIPGPMVDEEEELEKLFTAMEIWVPVPEEFVPENIHAARRDEMKRKLTDLVINHYEERGQQLTDLEKQNPGLGIPTLGDIERSYTLQTVDRLWMDHIDALDVMRAGIQFRSIGQRDPLVEYKNEAFRMFDNLKENIQHYIVDQLLKLMRGDITITVNRPEPQRKLPAPRPSQLKTNMEDIARVSGQAKTVDEIEKQASRSSNGIPRKNARPVSRGGSNRPATSTGSAPASRPLSSSPNPQKIGRNDLCYCGSGKKYKKCHGA